MIGGRSISGNFADYFGLVMREARENRQKEKKYKLFRCRECGREFDERETS